MTLITNPKALSRLIVGLILLSAMRLTAQTFTVLHNFAPNDGADLSTSLILSEHTLYGTAVSGGSSSNGTLFAVNTDGSDFRVLYTFTPTACPDCTNSDGAYPGTGLVLSGDTLYGTALEGGSSGVGTVYAIGTNGTGFRLLHTFDGSDGAYPQDQLILSGNTLYGTTVFGTIFSINTDGSGFTNIYRFPGSGTGPFIEVILSGNTLYGTSGFYDSCHASVFKLNLDGTGYTNLYCLGGMVDDGLQLHRLILSGSTLYGTTEFPGSFPPAGSVFAVNTDGSGFEELYSFTSFEDGSGPECQLIISGATLYGTTSVGGSAGQGTVFKVSTDGTGFATIHNFPDCSGPDHVNTGGASPSSGLLLAGNTLYGTTSAGGTSGKGTLFSISFAPQLTITPSGTNLVLTWPTNVAGFDYTGFVFQSTTNLIPPVVWSTNSVAAGLVNGLSVVTNPISGSQKFYRLVR